MREVTCFNCRGRQIRRAGGLCLVCHKDPAVRARFPPRTTYPAVRADGHNEPTEEELDALIARQLANKPAWWAAEEAREIAANRAAADRAARAIRRVAASARGRTRDQFCLRW